MQQMHAISSDLSFYHGDTKLGPARKFAIDVVVDVLGMATSSFRALARCNCHMDGYDPVLLTFNMGFGKVTKICLK